MMLQKVANYPTGYLYFILARFIGLSVKPFFLMYLLAHGLKNEAAMLSEVFLFLSGIFVLFAAPVHFEYYKLFFENKKKFIDIRSVFNEYINNLIMHLLWILPIVFILSLSISKNFLFASLITVLLLIEKSFDEIQRFLQFSKNFVAWSNIFLIKNLFPVITILIYIELFGAKNSIYFYMMISILVGVIIFVKFVPSFVKRVFFVKLKKIDWKILKKYTKIFSKRYASKYFQGISRANILNIDKWIALWLYSPTLLSELMLVGQFGNIINIGTNYATVSHRRAELINSKNTISSLMIGYKVPMAAFSLFVVVMIVLFGFDVLTQKGITELDTFHTVAIGVAYMFFAVTQLLTEYLFWNAPMKKVLLIDTIYYVFIISGGLFLFYINAYVLIVLFFLIGNIFRFIAQLIYIYTIGKKHANKP